MDKKQVFIIGYEETNVKRLQNLSEAQYCEFVPALYYEEMRASNEYDIENLLNLCFSRIDEHGQIDAIASYYDFPGTLLVAIIAAKYGLPASSTESAFKCEHKYWSRLEQSKVVQEHIPQFKAFDPFEEEVFRSLGMVTPFWIKPIKSFRSYLAYRINGEASFYECMEEVRAHINSILDPFVQLMKKYSMPEEFTSMPETCIAESPITGHQCTVEGYAYQGKVVIYGIVDSIRDEDRSSFSRYEYPSSLPQEVQFRMADVSRRVITQLEYDNAPFNIEYFYDPTADEVYLLEINPRISQSHADMFEKVHGVSHHSVMLSLALGKKPRTLENKGSFNKASNFMLRAFQDGKVKQVPSQREINILKKFIPGLEVNINVKEGIQLSDLTNQDSYSYELANIFIGARDQRELVDKYRQCLDGLTFDIEFDVEHMIH